MADSGRERAEELFANWIHGVLGEGEGSFDTLCGEHPSLEDELRAARADFERAAAQLGRGARLPSLLARTFGDEADPAVTLEEEPSGDTELEARLGARRSRYRVLSEVGRGGMGAVLEAWDADIRRRVAMKVMLRSREGGAADRIPLSRAVGRFVEEAQVTGQLQHPGVVPVHELGVDEEGRVYFCMSLVRGRHLGEIIGEVHSESTEWSTARAAGVVLKVCETMAFAHDRGVLHRDLKPANVMVGEYGEVYVMDWGLARVVGSDRPDALQSDRLKAAEQGPDSGLRTEEGSAVGTPAYMSPEQALGRLGELDERSDVYALGAMLYALLAGRSPYVDPEVRRPAREVVAAVIEGPPAPLGELAPKAPPELVAVCERAMARAKDDRYPSMQELASDLRAWLEGRVVRAYETGALAELRKWVLRNKAIATTTAAALLAVFGTLGGSSVVLADKNRELETTNGELDDVNVRLVEEKREAERQKNGVLGLSAFREHAQLVDEAEELWPPFPERAPDFEDWLARARALVAQLDGASGDYPGHRAMLDEVRARGTRDEAEGTWVFADEGDAWWHENLSRLIELLEGFADPETGLMGESFAPDAGWGVGRRLATARELESSLAEGAAIRERWEEARPLLARAGFDLPVITGLVPIGPDPVTGLWEFWHVLSGEEPVRSAEGQFAVTPDTGLVFVLLPGGTFALGSQAGDPGGPNYDPRSGPNDGPPRDVTLDPYFLSKYEMTQGQWLRLTGTNPSYTMPQDVRRRNFPVENVSWLECMRVLARFGLTLPTEAQWEYGARGGTSSIWWTGDDRESLLGTVNLADQAAARMGSRWTAIADWPELDDGWGLSAPVHSFEPNPFGLYNVHGNVWEWCRDVYGPPNAELEPGTGERIVIRESSFGLRYSFRGGGFEASAGLARITSRFNDQATGKAGSRGLRPVIRIPLR